MITFRTRRAAAVAAGVALLVGLGACSQKPEVPTAEEGDCIESLSTLGQVEELPVIDCEEPHEFQVIGVFDVEGDDFPGAGALNDEGLERCEGLFEDFVGVSYFETNLSFSPLTPSESGWNDADDREIICLAFRDDGADLTESIEDNAEAFPRT